MNEMTALIWMILTTVNGEARAVFGEYQTQTECQIAIERLEHLTPSTAGSMQCVFKVVYYK